jgi:alkylation response protein AidB-like acyl-CoA dehydrogenase
VDQQEYQQLAHQFASHQMLPHAQKWDEDKHLPVDVLRKAAELGFAAVYIDPQFGGTGLSRKDAAVIFEQLAKACPSTTALLTIHNMNCWVIDKFASQYLKEKYLQDMTALRKFASYCLTEPNSGSDAASLQTRAVKNGNKYVLNGSKMFISGGGFSDLYIVMARTGGPGPKGISCFVVEKGTKGLSFGPNEKKMGWNTQPTCVVNFEDCEIDAENLVGEEGQGFKIAMAGLDGGRINIGATSLGGAQFCLDQTIEYAKVRKQFGKPLSELQSVQFKLADMFTNLEISRSMIYKAAELLDAKDPSATLYCAMAKRIATDNCFQIANECIQIHGGYGYLKDYQIERYVRDLRVHQILEGTNEIMRVIVARNILQ